MISGLFHTLFYDPIYNGLIFLIDIVPLSDVGIAIILITVLVKLILFPISQKAVRTQFLMRGLQPQLERIKKKYAKDKQAQARKTMDLYKEKGINPFSGILLIFIQIPIIFALYWVFFRGGLPEIDLSILYSFINEPSKINMNFLGLIPMDGRSIVLAFLAGLSQYFQIKLSLPDLKKRDDKASLKDDFARSFQLQMRYMLPLFIFGFSYFVSAAVALYWFTSNIFAIGQEIFLRGRLAKEKKD
ncbi:membrane protein insertase YidC [Patescibacteria group bacterium]|nr:membrane protein insertase YidC [Patescibacteria group bacterium]